MILQQLSLIADPSQSFDVLYGYMIEETFQPRPSFVLDSHAVRVAVFG